MAPHLSSVGHSSHPLSTFLWLLREHGITMVADVRSAPYSRRYPHFCRDPFKAALAAAGIGYAFLGRELGARSRDPACYEGGRVQYERLARTAAFREGLERLETLADTHRVAMMCAEAEPLDCHRTILVARHLVARGGRVQHILPDARLEDHADAMARLRRRLRLPEEDLFRSQAELDAEAYQQQGQRIAYVRPGPGAPDG
jgi:uncharacterized protein (DUF488 family)